MGVGWSHFARIRGSLRPESVTAITSSRESHEGMAEGKQRDIANQHNFISESWISTEDMRRYSSALSDTEEFLSRCKCILDRQRKLESDLDTCQERLRRFTEDHARQSESNVENITSTNSPSTLEWKYGDFYDHQRMDALDEIENSRLQANRDKRTEAKDGRVACLIFEESYVAAQTFKASFLQGISLILTSAPAIGAQYNEAKRKSSEFQFSFKVNDGQASPLSQSNENLLKVIMKETADNCNVEALVQTTVSALKTRQDAGRFQDYNRDFFLENVKIKKYIENCCKYTWKLVCQTTPYVIEGQFNIKGRTVFNPERHQFGRDLAPSDHGSGHFRTVVWPGLLDGSSGRVIRKTEVSLD